MPTSHCKHPQHHRCPSAWPPLAWIAALGAGALIVAHWHEVVVALLVVAVLAALAVPVLLLWHNHGSGYDPELEHQAAAERRQIASYSITSASSPNEVPAARAAALEAGPVVHQHVHFHGISADEMAEAVRTTIGIPEDTRP